MALGIPVVSYENRFARNSSNTGALVVIKSLDPQEYAKACLYIWENKIIRDELIFKAKSFIKTYVELTELDRYELICDKITSVLRNTK